jgi:hypothetical protein
LASARRATSTGSSRSFQDFEASYGDQPQIALLNDDAKPPPTFAIATSSRMKGIIEKYETSRSSSRAFYDKLKRERRLLIWDGDDLLRDARQVLSRRYEVPPTVELQSVCGWNSSGPVRVGIVRAGDLAALEEAHGPGLFFENVRGWKGLDPTQERRDGQRVNSAHGARTSRRRCWPATTASSSAPAESIRTKGRLVLYDASIVNGRQTTGVLAEVRAQLGDDCEIVAKVVEAEGDAWPYRRRGQQSEHRRAHRPALGPLLPRATRPAGAVLRRRR